ncbi:MAG TPA: hypothetical protein VMN03_14730 [Burkholderiales bacterium]|nr:hypothetical protein [Burkholderiales bacterium]
MRTLKLLTMLLIGPAVALAQDASQARSGQETALAALARLDAVLPAELAQEIRAIVTDATNRGLPGLAIANRVLEGVAKGRSGAEVRAAAEAFARDLAGSRAAFAQAGRAPDLSELEAGATAMALGVDGQNIAGFARDADRSRPLAVAVAVLGALVGAEIPVDVASAAVLKRFNGGADNTELVEMPGQAGRMIAEGMRPSEVGLALASQRSGMTLPAGPPSSVPAGDGPPPNVPRNDGRPGERPVQPPVQPPVPTP